MIAINKIDGGKPTQQNPTLLAINPLLLIGSSRVGAMKWNPWFLLEIPGGVEDDGTSRRGEPVIFIFSMKSKM